MKRTFTVAEARTNLRSLLNAVEHGERGERGEHGEHGEGFWSAYEAWREDTPPEDLGLAEDYFSNLRDRTPGRDVKL